MQLCVDAYPIVGASVGRSIALLLVSGAESSRGSFYQCDGIVRTLLVEAHGAGVRATAACDDKRVVVLGSASISAAPSVVDRAALAKKPMGLLWLRVPAARRPGNDATDAHESCAPAGSEAATESALIVLDRSGEATALPYPLVGSKRRSLLTHTASILTAGVVVGSQASNDGGSAFLITADRDDKIRVSHLPHAWNVAAYCLGHTKFVSCLGLVPRPSASGSGVTGSSAATAPLLVSGGGDSTLRLWSWQSGTLLHTLYFSAGGVAVAAVGVHNDGRMNCGGGGSGGADGDAQEAIGARGDDAEHEDDTAADEAAVATRGIHAADHSATATTTGEVDVAAASAAASRHTMPRAYTGAGRAKAARLAAADVEDDEGGAADADVDAAPRGVEVTPPLFPCALAVHGPSATVALFLAGEQAVRVVRVVAVQQQGSAIASHRLLQVCVIPTGSRPLAVAFDPSPLSTAASPVLLVGLCSGSEQLSGAATDGAARGGDAQLLQFRVSAWRLSTIEGSDGSTSYEPVDAPIAIALNAALCGDAFAADKAFVGGVSAAREAINAQGNAVVERIADFV